MPGYDRDDRRVARPAGRPRRRHDARTSSPSGSPRRCAEVRADLLALTADDLAGAHQPRDGQARAARGSTSSASSRTTTARSSRVADDADGDAAGGRAARGRVAAPARRSALCRHIVRAVLAYAAGASTSRRPYGRGTRARSTDEALRCAAPRRCGAAVRWSRAASPRPSSAPPSRWRCCTTSRPPSASSSRTTSPTPAATAPTSPRASTSSPRSTPSAPWTRESGVSRSRRLRRASRPRRGRTAASPPRHRPRPRSPPRPRRGAPSRLASPRPALAVGDVEAALAPPRRLRGGAAVASAARAERAGRAGCRGRRTSARSSPTSPSATRAPTRRSTRCGSRSSRARPCCAPTRCAPAASRRCSPAARARRAETEVGGGRLVGLGTRVRQVGRLVDVDALVYDTVAHRVLALGRTFGDPDVPPSRSPSSPRPRSSARSRSRGVGAGQLIATGGRRSPGGRLQARPAPRGALRAALRVGHATCRRPTLVEGVAEARGMRGRRPPPLAPAHRRRGPRRHPARRRSSAAGFHVATQSVVAQVRDALGGELVDRSPVPPPRRGRRRAAARRARRPAQPLFVAGEVRAARRRDRDHADRARRRGGRRRPPHGPARRRPRRPAASVAFDAAGERDPARRAGGRRSTCTTSSPRSASCSSPAPTRADRSVRDTWADPRRAPPTTTAASCSPRAVQRVSPTPSPPAPTTRPGPRRAPSPPPSRSPPTLELALALWTAAHSSRRRASATRRAGFLTCPA